MVSILQTKKARKDTMEYTLAIGADHRGFALKRDLITRSQYGQHTVSWEDVGTESDERTDYPIYTKRVVELVLAGQVDYGILTCGSGIGVSIAANRFKGIFAGLVWNEVLAQAAKEHDNVNVLILPADYMETKLAQECVIAWLSAEFRKGRYLERLRMIDE